MNSSITSLNKKGLSALVLLLIWQLLALQMDSFILPSPLETGEAVLIYMQEAVFYEALWRTFFKLIVSMGCVLVLGGGLGLLIGLRPKWKPYVEPIIDMMQSVPPIAWLGISIIWFGLTEMPAILIIVLSTTPVLFTNVYEGVADLDTKLIRMAKVFDVPIRKRIYHIMLPSLKNYLKSGLITSAGLGWKLAVMAELLTSGEGIGGLLFNARTNLDTQKVFALALVMAVFWNLIKLLINLGFRSRVPASSKKIRMTHL